MVENPGLFRRSKPKPELGRFQNLPKIPKILIKWSKHKKWFFSAPEHAGAVFNMFLEWIYFRNFRVLDRNFRHFRNYRLLSSGFLNLIFRKSFGKFRETFGGPKPLFIFEKFSTVEKPGLSIIAKIFGQRSALLQIDSSSPLSLILSFVFYVSFEICLR